MSAHIELITLCVNGHTNIYSLHFSGSGSIDLVVIIWDHYSIGP